jgi:hypothetical protein
MNGNGNISLSGGSSLSGRDDVSLNANATVSNMQEVYVCSWPWLIIFVVATTVMLVMAIAGAYYDLKSQGPGILGIVHCSRGIRSTSMYQREKIC